MKNPRKLLFPLAALPALLCSCAKEIVMDAGEEPVVAVECILSEQPVQTLRLSFTKGAAMDEAPALAEADAVLIDLTEGRTVGSFERQDDGTWALDYAAVPEHSYRLEIDIPGQEPIWAEQTMPIECTVGTIFGGLLSSSSFDQSLYGSRYKLNRSKYAVWIRALNYNPETGRRETAELLCTDAPDADNFNITGETYDPPVSDTDVWGDKRSAFLYPNLEDTPLHRKYIRLGKLSSDENIFSLIYLSGTLTGKYYHRENLMSTIPIDRAPMDDEGIVLMAYASDNYDNYLRDAVYMQQLSESSDLSAIYVRDNIFSNIHGGLGIFGAITETVVEWAPAYTNIELLQTER